MKSTLVLVQSLFGGGAEKQIRLLLNQFKYSKPHVLFLGEPDGRSVSYLETIGVSYDCCKNKSVFGSLLDVFRVIKRKRPDNVFSGVLNVNFGTAILNFIDPSPTRKYIVRESGLLSQYHYGVISPLVKMVYRVTYPRLHLILLQSEFHLSDCQDYFKTKNTVIMRNLLEEEGLSAKKKLQASKQAPDNFNFVWVGRFSHEKDPLLATRIIKNLVLLDVKCTLRMYGEGALKDMVEQIVKEEGLDEHITFEGFVDNPFKDCKMSEILLLTSIQDTYPNTVLEAEMVPMLTVSVDHYGSINEMSKISPNILVTPRDPELAAILLKKNLPGRNAVYPSALLKSHQSGVFADVLGDLF